MRRFRFKVPSDDYRPMAWPPEGPFWCTGYDSEDIAILVAYSPDQETLTGPQRWPDATDIEDLGEQEVSFSSRFPQPEWWPA